MNCQASFPSHRFSTASYLLFYFFRVLFHPRSSTIPNYVSSSNELLPFRLFYFHWILTFWVMPTIFPSWVFPLSNFFFVPMFVVSCIFPLYKLTLLQSPSIFSSETFFRICFIKCSHYNVFALLEYFFTTGYFLLPSSFYSIQYFLCCVSFNIFKNIFSAKHFPASILCIFYVAYSYPS